MASAITTLYEEQQHARLTYLVVVASHILNPRPESVTWTFEIGAVPTAAFVIDNVDEPPAYLVEDASVQIYVGFNDVNVIVFNGTIESVSPSEEQVIIQCSGMSKALDNPYKRTILETDGVLTANQLVSAIIDAAGLTNYVANLPTWIPGTAVPQTIQFQSYGEGVNKIAEVDGSPWYEMPSGQVRVELRDAIPSATVFREYFSGVLTQDGDEVIYSQPANVSNANAYPRIRGGDIEILRKEVRNQVSVRGAQVETVGPDDSINTDVLETTADASSPWIPAGQFWDFVFSNELIDTAEKVAAVAVRYLLLLNRLNESVSLTVEGDPEIFLGATVGVYDDKYLRRSDRYFVQGYTSTISGNDFVTELDLIGGRNAGTNAFIDPFAEFTWANEYVAIPYGYDRNLDNQSNYSQVAAKVTQFVPMNIGNADIGEGTNGRMVIVTFDGNPSRDFDGFIETWEWTDDQGHVGTGPLWTVAYDETGPTSVDVTLTVTDNDGRTDVLTKNVLLRVAPPENGYINGDDTIIYGGVLYVNNIYVAAAEYCMCTLDGGETWVDRPRAEVLDPQMLKEFGVTGTIGRVATCAYLDSDSAVAVFGTDDGEVLWTSDGCENVELVAVIEGDQTILCIETDPLARGTFFLGTSSGRIYISEDYGRSWGLFHDFDDGHPIHRMFLLSNGDIICVGGDTGDINTLMRRLERAGPSTGPGFPIVPGATLIPEWDLLTQIFAQGGGHTIIDAAMNGEGEIMILFDSVENPTFEYLAWRGSINLPEAAWTPQIPNIDVMDWPTGGRCVARDQRASHYIFGADDNFAYYSEGGSTFEQRASFGGSVRCLHWEEGQFGVHLAGTSDGILKGIEAGAGWDYARPNVALDPPGDDWPMGADAHQIAVIAQPFIIPVAELFAAVEPLD